MRTSTIGMLAAVLCGLPGLAWAQESSGDPFAGQRIARRWCSNCHVVERMTQERSTDVAPSFSAVAKMPSTTSASVHAFLQTSHGQMPDFKLSRTEIDDVTAYILQLRK